MIAILRRAILVGIFCVFSVSSALADEVLMPFVLAYKTTGDVSAVASDVKGKLTGAGFQIAGEYSPYAGADVIVVTNDALKSAASKSERGGYGAAQRVAVTKNGDDIEVSYTNPVYMAAAYRMATDLSDVRAQLKEALGAESDFGSEENLTAEDLRHYRYNAEHTLGLLEKFDDPSKLAEYGSHAEAVKAVAEGLAAGKGGTAEVYRIDIPGKDPEGREQTLFGVALKGLNANDCSGDEYIMSRIDKGAPRHTAHLPYEILVYGDNVEALYARFRIAIDWPSLSFLSWSNFTSKQSKTPVFFDIRCAPDYIEEALTKASSSRAR